MSICNFDIEKCEKIVEKDYDFEHSIPRFLSKYPYIYTSGSSLNEVKRYFILPIDVRNTLCNIPSDSTSSFPYFDKKNKKSVNMIASIEFLHDVICGNIVTNNGNKNPEIRYKRKLVKEFSDEEIKDFMSLLDY